MSQALHEQCYQMAASRMDVPMLTEDEGTLLFNCFTKFGSWIPTMARSLQDSEAAYNFRQLSGISDE